MSVVEIDGSAGEGGGQVLRSSLGMALVTGREVHIANVRARRKRPGLQRQHLTCVRAARDLSDGKVKGARLGSTDVRLRPGEVGSGARRWAVGTAGSTMLVMQSILPGALAHGGSHRWQIEGGTHNGASPPWPFVEACFFPVLRQMGAQVQGELLRPGFFPRGGGRIEVRIEPGALRPTELLERGGVRAVRATSVLSALPEHIARRELAVVELAFGSVHSDTWIVDDPIGPGNTLVLEIECEHVTAIFVGFGERGVPAEEVASRAVDEAEAWLDADVPVEEYLADQLLIPLVLAGGGGFRTVEPSLHTRTNMDVLRAFGAEFRCEERAGAWEVEVTRGVSPARG